MSFPILEEKHTDYYSNLRCNPNMQISLIRKAAIVEHIRLLNMAVTLLIVQRAVRLENLLDIVEKSKVNHLIFKRYKPKAS